MKPDPARVALIEYWRNSLADNDRLSIKKSDLKAAVRIESDTISNGSLPKDVLKKLFENEEERISRYNKKIKIFV